VRTRAAIESPADAPAFRGKVERSDGEHKLEQALSFSGKSN